MLYIIDFMNESLTDTIAVVCVYRNKFDYLSTPFKQRVYAPRLPYVGRGDTGTECIVDLYNKLPDVYKQLAIVCGNHKPLKLEIEEIGNLHKP
jgi:hypothetical protein